LSWQELHTPSNTNLGTVNVCDPVEQFFQSIIILDQSREIQAQKETLLKDLNVKPVGSHIIGKHI
jgi:hypothetical protein